MQEWETVSKKTGIKAIALLLILIIGIGGITVIALSVDEEDLQKELEKDYSKKYIDITAEHAKKMIEEDINIIVVDTRGCRCNWEEGHIPTAVWQTFAPYFENTAHDLLIYCQNGSESIEYCNLLVGHTFGNIYHLQGGIDAWEKNAYKIEKPKI